MIKKTWFLFLILGYFILNFAGVYTEKYAVQRPDGGVSIVYYFPGSNDTLDDVLRSQGLDNLPIAIVKDSDLPATREFREAWVKQGSKIREDAVKKQEIIAEETQKQEEKQAVLEKLKISEEEFEKINV